MQHSIKLKEKPSAEEWITQTEAAKIRGVSQPTIFGMIERGRIASLKIGGKTLVNRAEVEAFVPLPIGRPRKKPDKPKKQTGKE